MKDSAFSDTINGSGELTKFSTVLDLYQVGEGPGVTYTGVRKNSGMNTYITILKADYAELGEPQQITVTVEPGNTLGESEDFPSEDDEAA